MINAERIGGTVKNSSSSVVVSIVLTLFVIGFSLAPAKTSATLLAENLAQGWFTHAHDAQHTGVSSVASQPLQRIRWQTPVDLHPDLSSGELLIHYGSPLITSANTVIVPVKTGADSFRVEARQARGGSLKWKLSSDYQVPTASFTPSFGPVLAGNRLIVPAGGGTVLVRNAPDQTSGKVTRLAFYGLSNFHDDPLAYTQNVKINTPITTDKKGDIFFGFMVLGPTPVGLQGGLARIGKNGVGTWTSATFASSDATITKVMMNCAPALSLDESSLYVGVDNDFGFGYLLELDAGTLQTKHSVILLDPVSGSPALISDESSATPTIGPDGDVFFGVLENPFPDHHDRGWLLHFDSTLTLQKIPGSFGWDDTASIVDAALVSSYHGTSKYLVMTKYNNYAGVGGDGVNKVAVVDPNVSMPDPILGNSVMNDVLTVTGVTPDPNFPTLPGAVREWCINTAAVDPITKSILVNSEDGRLYRWDLTSNSLSEAITLTGGIGEAYTPTEIGPDGTAYAINRGVLFALGRN